MAKNRDRVLADLAKSLQAQGHHLSDLGRHDEAVRVSVEAVELHRELAAGNRDAFLPDLAIALCARGDVLKASGLLDAASDSYFEGIQLSLEIIHLAPDEIGPRVRFNLHCRRPPLRWQNRRRNRRAAETARPRPPAQIRASARAAPKNLG